MLSGNIFTPLDNPTFKSLNVELRWVSPYVYKYLGIICEYYNTSCSNTDVPFYSGIEISRTLNFSISSGDNSNQKSIVLDLFHY